MASLLRQIVAGPRSRHPEAGLDLCYVTPFIIATSGPSGTYPQRAYRNPLDQLVKFLDYKHQDKWAIWEFRAEGTGYPDEEVYGRVWHYPWPDHHPPPFGLVPLIMAGMRNWLLEDLDEDKVTKEKKGEGKERKEGDNGRVVVVHCKAGKGRSGTMACSYLISQCGWSPSEALARFTERRMRPGFGQGVSIPSQLRWVGYVDRWTKSGKVYVERQIEILEVHVWGLRDGVKVQVEGFVDEGKTIKLFHVFTKKERVVVDGSTLMDEASSPKDRNGKDSNAKDKMSDLAGFQNDDKAPTSSTASQDQSRAQNQPLPPKKSSTTSSTSSSSTLQPTSFEPGASAIIFRPSSRVILPTSDINIDFERRNKARMGYTFVTAVAHVWFNCFFEGNGPENPDHVPDDSGVFEIEWDKLDGIKGSSRKGTRALDKLAVVWKAYDPEEGRGRTEEKEGEVKGQVVHEPGPLSPVKQMAPADWKGGHQGNMSPSGSGKDLGLRTESPASANVSKASSLKSSPEREKEADRASVEGVKAYDGTGEDEDMDLNKLPQPKAENEAPSLEKLNLGLDTASATTGQRSVETQSPPQAQDAHIGHASTIATSSLPDGKPEDEMKNAKEHKLGHVSSIKKVVNS